MANFIQAFTVFVYDESNSFIHFAANGTKAFLWSRWQQLHTWSTWTFRQYRHITV